MSGKVENRNLNLQGGRFDMNSNFTQHSPNRFESSEGFSVEIEGRSRVRYSEGDKSILIESESMATEGSMVLYRASITKWDPPYGADVITERNCEEIVTRVVSAFVWRGYKLDVE